MGLRSIFGSCLVAAIAIAAIGFVAPHDRDQVIAAPAKSANYKELILPFLQKYCITCHNDKKEAGGFSLQKFNDEAAALKDRKTWEKIEHNIRSREMPPKDRLQPANADREQVLGWIESQQTKVDCGLAKDPGRPTIRRLNRAEYNNTIRDLLGVNFRPADDFPSDDVGYGFDNIGDVLSMPPILLEKYMAAAERIIEDAIVVEKPIKSLKKPYRSQDMFSTLGKESKEKGRIYLSAKGAAILQQEFEFEGEYVFRVKAYGTKGAGEAAPKLNMRVGDKELKSFDIAGTADKPSVSEVRTKVQAGKFAVTMEFVNGFDRRAKDAAKTERTLSVVGIEIEGPFNPVAKPLPVSHQRIMIAKPVSEKPADRETAARKIVENFARKAWRRPVRTEEVDRVLKLFKLTESKGEPFEEGIKLALRAVLVSPHFLFRVETDKEPNNPAAVHPVTDHELGTRLSYFLWASMPDDELSRLADQGRLREKGVLEAQVKRMLKDPKARALTENFAAQWLQLRTLQTAIPDRQTFPAYDGATRALLIRETELYFEHIVKEDRSVLEFIDSDYTFLNGPLARYYGVSGVTGSDFQKVTLTDKNRGGILTHGSILTLTSNPTRTSPVKRGKWVLENLLATPPPPAPMDVPELEEKGAVVASASLRQRLEAHRKNPTCASCHQKMDPLGFGLENFDGVGRWRTMDGKFKVDPSGILPDGAKFAGPEELRKVLLGKADLFRRCLAEKVLTYALGRGLEYYDKCVLDDLVKGLKSNQDRFSALVTAIVQSDPFQKRRGKRSE